MAAAVVSDPDGNLKMDPGALVRSNGGFLCIDEFDKLKDKDLAYITESMGYKFIFKLRSSSFSVTKAGMNRVFESDVSIIAACNPRGGKVNKSKPLYTKNNLEMLKWLLKARC